MMFFNPDTRDLSDEHKRVYAYFEVLYTLVDVLAAVCFIVGSVMFLYPALMVYATYLFIIGSCFFALRPVIKFARELKFLKMGNVSVLAERERE